MLMTFPRHIQN